MGRLRVGLADAREGEKAPFVERERERGRERESASEREAEGNAGVSVNFSQTVTNSRFANLDCTIFKEREEFSNGPRRRTTPEISA